MSAATILPLLESRLTKEEVFWFHDNDLFQVIAFTDTIMYQRTLTDSEVSNFWLVIDERRRRVQQQPASIVFRRFGPRKVAY